MASLILSIKCFVRNVCYERKRTKRKLRFRTSKQELQEGDKVTVFRYQICHFYQFPKFPRRILDALVPKCRKRGQVRVKLASSYYKQAKLTIKWPRWTSLRRPKRRRTDRSLQIQQLQPLSSLLQSPRGQRRPRRPREQLTSWPRQHQLLQR